MLLRLLVLIILGAIIYRAIKSWTRAGQKQQRMSNRSSGQIADDMVQDPQCGIYFPRREGIALSHQGRELLFCSPACKQAYLESH